MNKDESDKFVALDKLKARIEELERDKALLEKREHIRANEICELRDDLSEANVALRVMGRQMSKLEEALRDLLSKHDLTSTWGPGDGAAVERALKALNK